MKISPVFTSAYTSKVSKNHSKNTSFKGIYVDYATDIGDEKKDIYPASFKSNDALLLNEIARRYPNQDCFIGRGAQGKPYIEFRERPEDVQVYKVNKFNRYSIDVNPDSKDYPCIPLILHKNSDYNALIGLPSKKSDNPSLPFTVQLGFELHKKLIERKYQILSVLGENESIDLGGETASQKAYKGIKELEIAVTRYLLECAFASINNPDLKVDSFNYQQVKENLAEKRKQDLLTGSSDTIETDLIGKKDICELIRQRYPDVEENKKRIKEITDYIKIMGISLDRPNGMQ